MINFDKRGNIQFGTENNIQFTQPAEAAGVWNQFQADYRSSGYLPNGVSGNDLNVQQNEISFVTTTIDNVAAPVTDNEQLFITSGSSNNALAAISLDGSTINWQVNLGANITIPNQTCAPIGDVIFVIERNFDTFEHRLVTYDKLTGNEVNATGDISGASEAQGFPYFRIQNELVYGEIQGTLDYTEFNPVTLAQTSLIDSDQFQFNRIAHTEDFIIGEGLNLSGDQIIAKFDLSGNLIDTRLIGDGENLIDQLVIDLDDSVVYANVSDDGGGGAAININTFNTEWIAASNFSTICIDEDAIYLAAGDSINKFDKSDGSLIESVTSDNTVMDGFPAVTSDTLYVVGTSFFNGFTPGLVALNKDDLSTIFKVELPENNGLLCVTESSVSVLSSSNDEMYVIT